MNGLKTKHYTPTKIVAIIIGAALIICFRFLPAPAPITPTGMAVLGIFLGCVVLWSFVDVLWPSFLGILVFGFGGVAFSVYPNSILSASIYEATNRALGNYFITDLICMLLITYVLKESGLIRRLTLWFLTRKISSKSPWSFTVMLFLASFITCLFLENIATVMIFWAITEEIFAEMKMTPDDRWARMVTVWLAFVTAIVSVSTPIGHGFPLLFMTVFNSLTHIEINWIRYMAVAVPVALVICVGMVAYMRLFVKPDMTKLENADFSVISKMRAEIGKMKKQEKAILAIVIIMIILWLLPSIFSLTSPGTSIAAWMNALKATTPLLMVIVYLSVVRIEGKPLLNVRDAMGNTDFSIIFFSASVMLIASSLGESTTGIVAWLNGALSPIVANVGAFGLCAIVCIISIILTNITSNVTVGILMMSVSIPIASSAGLDPFIVALCVCLGSCSSYCLPTALTQIAICCSRPFGGQKYVFRWGLGATVISIIATVLLVYALGGAFRF